MPGFCSEQFKADMRGEKAVQQFFYRHAEGVGVFKALRRASLEEDRGGVDFTLSSPEIFNNIDVHYGDFKVALDYRSYGEGKGLSSFAFEILGLGSGESADGWLFGKKYQADFYCIQWLWMKDRSKAEKGVDFGVDDIDRLECCFILKSRIQGIIDKYNINCKTYRDCAKDMQYFEQLMSKHPGPKIRRVRLGSEETGVKLLLESDKNSIKLYLDPGATSKSLPRLQLSKGKIERPINILISKDELIDNALLHCVFHSNNQIYFDESSKYF